MRQGRQVFRMQPEIANAAGGNAQDIALRQSKAGQNLQSPLPRPQIPPAFRPTARRVIWIRTSTSWPSLAARSHIPLMTPLRSRCVTRRRQAEGDSPTAAAISTLEMRVLSCAAVGSNGQCYPSGWPFLSFRRWGHCGNGKRNRFSPVRVIQ